MPPLTSAAGLMMLLPADSCWQAASWVRSRFAGQRPCVFAATFGLSSPSQPP
jgi:hypothetical protein